MFHIGFNLPLIIMKLPTNKIFENCLEIAVMGDVWKLVDGAMSASLSILSLYSGLSDKQTKHTVAPTEYPTTSSLEYPVFFRMKSMTAGKSYTPISWKLKHKTRKTYFHSLG